MELDRRTLLKGAIGLVGSSVLSEAKATEPTPITPDFEIHETLTLDTALTWAKKFDRLKDKLPEEMEYNIHSMEEVDEWVAETTPFFEYEGITDPDRDVNEIGGLQYSDDIHFQYYDSGLRHNHVLGTTAIFGDEVTLNERYINPISPFYTRGDSVTTLVHELAHLQGIISDGTRIDAESSAQLVMLEIVSAMFLKGNELVLDSLLDDLRWMHYSSAKYIGLRDGQMDYVNEVRNEIFPSPYDQAQLDKSDRYWADNPKKLEQILHDYNFIPINEIHNSMTVGRDEIEGVYLPKNWIQNWGNYPPYNPDGYETYEFHKHRTDPLKVDDLTYFMDNCEPIVDFIVNGK